MRIKTTLFALMCVLSLWGATTINAAEHNPMPFEEYDDLVNPTLKLSAASMGGFFDAIKSYIHYTAAQNVPGTKESGVGYHYDNKTKKYERVLFYRMSQGYPRETNNPLDLFIESKNAFFVVELPGKWPAYTRDGRFIIEKDGLLVTHNERFPVLGEAGYIYLPSNQVDIDQLGVITYKQEMIDTIKIAVLKDTNKLKGFNHKIFYYDFEKMRSGEMLTDGKYLIKQGYFEDSSITKAYIGLVPEWENGHQANVKIVKSYIKNMQAAVQVANPQ